MTDDGPDHLHLRAATADDAPLLLSWRNDEQVRLVSRSTAPIAADEHARWLARTLADPDRHLLLVSSPDGGEALATTRYDLLSDAGPGRARWEVSITVAPRARGRGVGSTALQASDAWLAAAEPAAEEIVAHVRTDNTGSARLFERNGYSAVESSEPGFLRFVRPLRTR